MELCETHTAEYLSFIHSPFAHWYNTTMIEKVPSYKNPDNTLPFQTYEWSRIWFETVGKKYVPYILARDGQNVAPFARQGPVVTFSGGEDISDYQDIVGPKEDTVHTWKELISFLKADGATTIRLRNIPEDSPTLSYFRTLPHATIEREDTTPVLALPPAWDTYLEQLSTKDRHELKRKLRKFERDHANISLTSSVDVEILLSLMKLDPRKEEFLTPDMQEFFRRISEAFKENITLTVLTVDGHPAAATFEFVVGNTVMLYNSGFDEEHFSGAGFYLKATNIKRAIETGMTNYNFLQGKERYKYALGGKDFLVYKIDLTI